MARYDLSGKVALVTGAARGSASRRHGSCTGAGLGRGARPRRRRGARGGRADRPGRLRARRRPHRRGRAALPQVSERGGQIVFIGSIYSFANGLLASPYAVSKAGVEAAGRALRAELAPLGGATIVRALEERAPRAFAPAVWRYLSAARGRSTR
jgi:NAD(P)-dependent dehydrogenase (short-subunit alcohol dehydrogenase family)